MECGCRQVRKRRSRIAILVVYEDVAYPPPRVDPLPCSVVAPSVRLSVRITASNTVRRQVTSCCFCYRLSSALLRNQPHGARSVYRFCMAIAQAFVLMWRRLFVSLYTNHQRFNRCASVCLSVSTVQTYSIRPCTRRVCGCSIAQARVSIEGGVQRRSLCTSTAECFVYVIVFV